MKKDKKKIKMYKEITKNDKKLFTSYINCGTINTVKGGKPTSERKKRRRIANE
jgi:hypothetical protein